MKEDNPLKQKSFQLSVEVINYTRLLRSARYERSILDQFLRSATAPGALIAEANDCESKADMRHKFGVALKEAREAKYWLDLIECTGPTIEKHPEAASALINEVIAMLVASRKTLTVK